MLHPLTQETRHFLQASHNLPKILFSGISRPTVCTLTAIPGDRVYAVAMDRTAWIATRGGAVGAAAALAVVGLIFAIRGTGTSEGAEPTPSGPVFELVEVTATPSPALTEGTVTPSETAGTAGTNTPVR